MVYAFTGTTGVPVFVATLAPWPLTSVSVKGKGHFVVFFFSVIMRAYADSLIIQALPAMCNFLEISKPTKLFIIIITIIKAIERNSLTDILPIFVYLQRTSTGLFTTSVRLRGPLKQSISGTTFSFRRHPLK